MLALLIQLAILVIIVVGAWQLSSLLPPPIGRVVQIVVFVIAGVWVVLMLGSLIGVMPAPSLR